MGEDRLHKLQQFYDNDPGDTFVIFALAKEFENKGDDKRALELFLELAQKDPDYIGLFYHLGKLYERHDDYDNALKTYNLGIEKAQAQQDFHSLSELKNARIDLELEMED